ncbi:RHS repeat-associated core domain-containing protein [Paenibacillus sp. 481]|nr:RHS repeat-associated core domain-containing protein [Paenibacillus sp. 481]
MTDELGNHVWSCELDIYGNVRSLELKGKRSACPFQYEGQYEDEETGLYYNRFRYYPPHEGVYTQQDPIRLAGGMCLYGYVNDALIWVDPFGLSRECGSRASALRQTYSHLSSNERANRLQNLAEGNAHRILQDMANSIPGAHLLGIHGTQATMQSQYDRATHGIDPTTGVAATDRSGAPRLPPAATKFHSHRNQLNMIQRGTLDHGVSRSGQVFFNRNNQPTTAFPKWGQ